MGRSILGALLACALGAVALAGDPAPPPLVLRPVRLEKGPELRGDLSDPAWAQARLPDGAWGTYNPARGGAFTERTEVYLAYDAEALYVGFRCHDSQPGTIKASLSKRDDLWGDDWVGLSLDTFGTRHSAIHLFVNPLGIQGDALDSLASGEDSSPDWVWESKGARFPGGYTVELRLPFKSIRFKSGTDVRMGILFWRKITRLGISGSWPAMKAGDWVYQTHLPLQFAKLDAPLRLEVLPSVTYGRTSVHAAPGRWDRASSTELGIGVKAGLTSSITADLTYNPDFSQVESDAFQVEVNQRYPIFYSEKRPFFMESMGIFSLAGPSGDANMQVAVHTRKIVDPKWGAKVTGDEGPLSFGVLAAGDRAPGQAWADGENPGLGHAAAWTIARGLYGFGQGEYAGALWGSRAFDGGWNRVAGADFQIRPAAGQTLAGNVLQSWSADPGVADRKAGTGALLLWSYASRSLDLQATSEHYDPDFRMDTAFYNRTGIDQHTFYVGPNFHPKDSWITKVNPFLFGYVIHDNVTGLTDYLALAALRLNTVHGGSLRFDLQRVREGWKGLLFTKTVYRVNGGVWATRWLNVSGTLRYGRDVYYEADVPFQGPTRSVTGSLVLQPSQELRWTLDLNRVRMDAPDTGAPVFDVRTVNSQVTYQFNSSFFLRATVRTDSWRRRMLTDYLASFTYIPGTVLFLGYGEIQDKAEWVEGQWKPQGSRYEPMQRSLFFKVSYLWRN
ncbi:carbohydrate binding family 9 domain-containing protein [Mesoterricola sediminis]|uniref:DUF5916 domain-containing protein n=1 Tax=Mesoterricola sediminis TaxID=2927980 RepID=A0AA48H051_9BACT|nr:DUF5916 domain-containing protein [Mesoterricola sediminis]BDU78805.1 hypothetical protein METESE_37630 [Mesoterricola sediminis]